MSQPKLAWGGAVLAVPMPAPERLSTAQTFFSNGTVTLDPPAVGDQPVISAAQAWSQIGRQVPGATYKIVLARYSATVPASLVHGTLIPFYRMSSVG